MAKQLKEFLSSVFEGQGWKLKLLSEWETIAGGLANKVRLEKIDGNTLTVGVFQSSWLQELYLLSGVLKKSINDHLGYPHVEKLRFKHASPQAKPVTKKDRPIPSFAERLEPIALSAQEERALEKIKDEELKQALHKFLSRCHYKKVNN